MRRLDAYNVKIKFNAFHSVSDDRTKIHPHTFTLSVLICMVDDDYKYFEAAEHKLKELTGKMTGKVFNDMKYFENKPPTLENICEYFCFYAKKHINNEHLYVVSVAFADNPLKTVIMSDILISGTNNMYIRKKDIIRAQEKLDKYYFSE